jgi:hypothetical protein
MKNLLDVGLLQEGDEIKPKKGEIRATVTKEGTVRDLETGKVFQSTGQWWLDNCHRFNLQGTRGWDWFSLTRTGQPLLELKMEYLRMQGFNKKYAYHPRPNRRSLTMDGMSVPPPQMRRRPKRKVSPEMDEDESTILNAAPPEADYANTGNDGHHDELLHGHLDSNVYSGAAGQLQDYKNATYAQLCNLNDRLDALGTYLDRACEMLTQALSPALAPPVLKPAADTRK